MEKFEKIAAKNTDATSESSALDMQDLFQRFTLDSIGEIAFGVELGSLHQDVTFSKSFDIANEATFQRFFHPLYKIPYFPSKWEKDLRKAVNEVNEFSNRVIAERRNSNFSERTDLLSRYLSSLDTDGKPFSDTYLRDIVLSFIIAGRDTTAQLLTWSFYLLSQNLDKEAKLIEEIDRTLNGSLPDYNSIKNMPYLEAVLNETLRLWPPVPFEQKVPTEDDTLPNGVFIPKGTIILWSNHVLGRLKEYWDNPEQFQPERWFNEKGTKIPKPAAFIPFLAGPRSCLGQTMAMMEAKILTCLILQKYQLRLFPGFEVNYTITITLKAKDGMKMNVIRRS